MYSTEIDRLVFDRKAIDRDYIVAKARLREAARRNLNGSDVLKLATPSSMFSEKGGLWMLLPRSASEVSYKSDKIIIEPVPAATVPDLCLARLFLRETAAMPGTTAWGLFRMGKGTKCKNGQAYETLSFDIEKRHSNQLILTIRPHVMGEEECYSDKEKLKDLQRYRMTPSGCFNAAPKGNFFCRKLGKKKLAIDNLNTGAIERGDLTAFYGTKLGAFAWLLSEGLPQVSNYIKEFSLSELGGYVQRIRQPEIKSQYKAIKEMLRETIGVVDLTECGIAKYVCDALIDQGFQASVNMEVPPDGPAVIITKTPEVYSLDDDEHDPYLDVKKINPWTQFVTLESLGYSAGKGECAANKAIAEVLGKELSIKKQVLMGQFGFLNPPPGLVFGYEDILEDQTEYHLLETHPGGKFSYRVLYDSQIFDEFSALPQFSDVGKLGRNTFIYRKSDCGCWQIRDTGLHAMVDPLRLKNFVAKLSAAASETVPVDLVMEFLRNHRHKINETVFQQIESITQTQAEAGSISLGAFTAAKPTIRNRPKYGKEFFSFIEAETGYTIKEGVRGKESTLYDGVVGLWWDESTGRYFVGEPDNQSNVGTRACPIKELVAFGPPVESWLKDLLMVFFVRHKQGTVRPYPFKYLDEAIAIATLYGSSTKSLQKA